MAVSTDGLVSQACEARLQLLFSRLDEAGALALELQEQGLGPDFCLCWHFRLYVVCYIPNGHQHLAWDIITFSGLLPIVKAAQPPHMPPRQ